MARVHGAGMPAQDDRSPAQATQHPADILIVGDAAWVGPLAHEPNVVVRSTLPGPACELTLQGMHHGVVVVVVPPADEATILLVAHMRRRRPGIRAVLVDPAAASGRRLAALGAGFDDALPRELGTAEMSARVAIQLLRARATTATRLAVGTGVELDLDARALRRRGRFVHLRPLEFRLLEVLCQTPGRALSRAWLLDRAWGAAPPAGSRTLDVHMRWLREKVEHDPDHPVHLLTVRGVGYRLEPDDREPPVAIDKPHNVSRGLTNR